MQDSFSFLVLDWSAVAPIVLSIAGWLGVALLLNWALVGPRWRLIVVALILLAAYTVLLLLTAAAMAEAAQHLWWD